MDLTYNETSLPGIRLTQLTAHVDEQGEIGALVGPMFERLATALGQAGVEVKHPGIAWYDTAGEGISIGVGFADVPATGLDGESTVDLPAVPRAVVATYRGAMEHLGRAWQELAAHVSRAGLEFAGPSREVYLSAQGPQEEWVTELQQPVAERG